MRQPKKQITSITPATIDQAIFAVFFIAVTCSDERQPSPSGRQSGF
jgi:hypothetical protein